MEDNKFKFDNLIREWKSKLVSTDDGQKLRNHIILDNNMESLKRKIDDFLNKNKTRVVEVAMEHSTKITEKKIVDNQFLGIIKYIEN